MTLDVAALPAGVAARPAPDFDLATRARADGVRFLLALFVDLTGKPCAKLVPVEAADELQRDGVGFAGYAVGAIGQQPQDPDLIAIPDVAVLHAAALHPGGPGHRALRPARRGRAVAVRARGCILKSSSRGPPTVGLELFKVGAEVEYFLVERGRGRRAAPRPTRSDDAARPCYDARGVTRMYDHLTAISDGDERAGLGQLRQRPRGRATASSSRTSPTPTR